MTDEQLKIIQAYHLVFDNEHGKIVLADLRKWSGYESRIIPTGQRGQVEFELGRRDMFLHILDKLNLDPDAVQQAEQITEEEE